MKKRFLTLAIVVLFVLTLIPLGGITVAAPAAGLERVDLRPIDPGAAANNNDSNQMGWATEGFEDEGAEADVEAAVAQRAVYLALKMPEMPGFMQFILQTPAGWWQQSDYGEDDLVNFWSDSESVLRLPFYGADGWDPDDVRAKIQIAYYDDGVMDLGITDQWLEVHPEVNEGDLFEIRLLDTNAAANNNDQQMGWSTEGFEGEDTPLDVAAGILMRATHLVLEMPEAPGFMQFILQTPVGWWQQVDFDGDTLAGFYDDGKLSLPITGDWDPTDVRAKFLVAYYDDNPMDLGITGVWLLIGPEVTLGAVEPPKEIGPPGSIPFNMGTGDMIWGDKFTQLGWNGDQRAADNKEPFPGPNEEGGLYAGLLLEANWFVIYVDNAPDDYEHEMLELMIFGGAQALNWSWDGGKMEAPTVQIYDTFVPGAIAFPLGGHPYVEALRQEDADGLESRNFAICFTYGGGIENLGVTEVWLYDELPVEAAPEPPPPPATPAPTPEPILNEVVDAAEGFPWWGWALIVGGGAAAAAVIVFFVKKKQ